MGYENCGRKPISLKSAEVKRKLAEIAFQGVKYLGQCAEGKVRPAPKRLDIIFQAIDHTIGRPKQQVDTTVSGELALSGQLRALSEADLAALLALIRERIAAQPLLEAPAIIDLEVLDD